MVLNICLLNITNNQEQLVHQQTMTEQEQQQQSFNIKELLTNQQQCEYHMTSSVSGNNHMVLENDNKFCCLIRS